MSTLNQVRELIKDHLESFAEFDGVEILVKKPKDIGAAIDEALAQLGTCIIIIPAKGGMDNPQLPGPILNDCEFLLRVYQNITLDESQDAWALAEAISTRCHLVLLDEEKQLKLRCKRDTIDMGDDVGSEDQPCLTIDVPLQVHVRLGAAWEKVATPVIVYDEAGRVQMSCATAGAQIFYTVDGSRPRPGNGTVYTSTLEDVADPSVFKARAYLHGMIVSEIATPVAGDIQEDVVTLEQMNAALAAANSPFRWSSTGIPLIKATDGKWTPIVVTVGPAPDLDRSVVASQDATEEIP